MEDPEINRCIALKEMGRWKKEEGRWKRKTRKRLRDGGDIDL
jgi:hypothetical protein